MRRKLATLMFLVAAAASMATSAPSVPTIGNTQDLEPIRIDDELETTAIRVVVRFPRYDLKQEDFEVANLGFDANLDPASDTTVIAKSETTGANSGMFKRLDRTNSQGEINGPFNVVCDAEFCAYEGTISLERVGTGSALVGGTVAAAVSWSNDVDNKAKTPANGQLEISFVR